MQGAIFLNLLGGRQRHSYADCKRDLFFFKKSNRSANQNKIIILACVFPPLKIKQINCHDATLEKLYSGNVSVVYGSKASLAIILPNYSLIWCRKRGEQLILHTFQIQRHGINGIPFVRWVQDGQLSIWGFLPVSLWSLHQRQKLKRFSKGCS